MRKAGLILTLLCFSGACSPRDFLTRRLASALISASETFSAPQQFWLRIGPVSVKDYSPAPCYEVALTPAGVDAFHDLIRGTETGKEYFSVPTARRELVSVTGISKNENLADVEFIWKWAPLNEVGSALNVGGVQYKSTVAMKHYDDGWRLVEAGGARSGQPMDDALKNADPVP